MEDQYTTVQAACFEHGSDAWHHSMKLHWLYQLIQQHVKLQYYLLRYHDRGMQFSWIALYENETTYDNLLLASDDFVI